MGSLRLLSILMTLPIVSGLKSGEFETSHETPRLHHNQAVSLSPFSENDRFNLPHFSSDFTASGYSISPFNESLLSSIQKNHSFQTHSTHDQPLSSLESIPVEENCSLQQVEEQILVQDLAVQTEKSTAQRDDFDCDPITFELIQFIEEAQMTALETGLESNSNLLDISFATPSFYPVHQNRESFQAVPISLLGNWFVHETTMEHVEFSKNGIQNQEKDEPSHASLQVTPIVDAPLPSQQSPSTVTQNPYIPSEVATPEFEIASVENTPLPHKQYKPQTSQNSSPSIAASQFQETPIENTPLPNPSQKPVSATNRISDSEVIATQNLAELFLLELGAVYLRPYQGGTDFAETVNESDFNPKGTLPYGTNQPLDFNFDWGLRAGIGYKGAGSRQTISASYLYFSSHAQKSLKFTPTSNGGGNAKALGVSSQFILAPTFGFGDIQNGEFFSGFSSWDLKFNMLDILFSKKIAQKGCMSFAPFIGLKGVALWEIQRINLARPNAAVHIKQKNDLKGIGPIAGFQLDWILTSWLSIVGTIDGALLASKIETSRTSDNGISSALWIGSSKDYKGTPVLDGMLAFKGVYCWDSGRYIDLKIGFEEHYVFQTMKHYLLNSDSSTNLSLMGWFATIGVGF